MASDPRIHIPKSQPPKIDTYTVLGPVAELRRKSSHKSPIETQLLKGTHFDIHHISRGWVWGRARSPVPGFKLGGYVGYLPLKALIPLKQTHTHRITALNAPVFKAADIKSRVAESLSLNCRVNAKQTGDFIATPEGFIHQNHVQGLRGAPILADYTAVAERLLGQPYVWGGVSSNGLDCSGLVQTAFRACGQDMPRDSDMQAEMGQDIPTDGQLRRGDLVFWKGHVGIMQGEGRLLHANAFHMCVASEPLAEAARRINSSGGGDITARRRLD